MPFYQTEHAMKGSLRSRDGNFVYQLRFPVTTVGREGNDIILQSPNVEREHAVIEYDESQGCFVVQDLNSAHGTYVNECRVQNAAVRLAPGDIIRFGFGNAGFEFLIDQIPPVHYSTGQPRPWESYSLRVVSSSSGTTLPYINTTLPTSGDTGPVHQSSQAVALPNARVMMSDARGTEKKSGVMPHPPLRSRPISAGTTRTRPGSAGRERPPTINTGGWVGAAATGTSDQLSVTELEERLLRMGDELSRLASYESECHRKDGVISALRDEVTDLKSAVGEQQGFRGGRDDSAFSSSSIISDLRQQVTQLQNILKEKEEMERTSAQKLATYQHQLHTKNEEVSSLKDELQAKPKHTAWIKADPNASTNTIASLRTEVAEKDRKIAQLNNTAEKLNKQKMQSTTLMNSLQRENSAKDALIHQAKNEIERLRKDVREKEVTISNMSAKITRQRVAKEVEQEAAQKDKELIAVKGKLQTTEKQLKEKCKIVAEQQQELDNLDNQLSQGKWSDRNLEQELDHAKAQWLDAQRNEKLMKVDLQQLEKRFDRFRRKVIQYTFSNSSRFPERELDDDELADHVRQLAQEKVTLVDEIKQYADAESEKEERVASQKDAEADLKKQLYSMEKRLSKSGRSCQALEEEFTILEEMTVQDSVSWLKDLMCKLLSSELRWQKKSEEAMRRIGDDSDSESSFSVEDICKQLKASKNECRKLKGKISEMEETHQEVIIKLREDLKREEEKNVHRAVSALRAEEEENQHKMIQEFRHKERERIQAAVDAERRIMESQQGSVTQLKQVLSEKQRELENHKQALATANSEYAEAKGSLQRNKETENQLRRQLQEQAVTHQAQVARLEREKNEVKNYKEEDVASFKEQTRQHALTIVAMEERLLKLAKQNKQLEQELISSKQYSVRNHRPPSPLKDKSRPTSPRKESPRPQSPKKDLKPQMRSVETETVPQTSVEAAMQSDIYKLEQLVLLLRREASQAKKDAQSQADVVQALRRDLAGASARMSDMAGELSDKQKQKLEDYEKRINEQDSELDAQRKQLGKLSALVDEQQKEINDREGKLSEQHRVLAKQKKEVVRKGSELVAYKSQLACQLDEQQEQLEQIEKETKTSTELTSMGARCRGERHDHVIARQKEALAEMRQKTKTLEQLKPPLPSHEQALQQVVALKKEVSELRAKLANVEEDYHKSETEMHSELRVRREEAAIKTTESDFEKSSHRHTKEALDMSEKSYLKLARTLAAILEIETLPGCRSMAHLPEEERDRLEADRSTAVDMLREKVTLLFERLDRKERLLGGYENDLASLRETETVAGLKTAEASGLKLDVRNRTEEVAYLREALSRHREELDQQRRLNICLKERKKFAMDMEERELRKPIHSHNCYVDEQTRYKDEIKRKKAAEKARRKNYEIESLKKELRSADRELNETAAKLQALENSRSLTSAYSEDFEDTGQLEYDE